MSFGRRVLALVSLLGFLAGCGSSPPPYVPKAESLPAVVEAPKEKPFVEPDEDDYDALHNAGKAALEKKHYPEAIRYLAIAVRLSADPDTVESLHEARYQQRRAEGRDAVREKRLADAVNAYTAALAEKPGDKIAQTELDNASAELDTLFANHMKDGNQAIKQKKYALALKEFDAALSLKPSDGQALAGRKEAQNASDPARKAAYEMHMKAGQASMNRKKIGDAIAEFEAALREMPGDKAAQAALSKARGGK